MLSLIIPTYNEAENIPELLPKLHNVLKDIPHELIVVDDNSPDETWRVAQEVSEHLEHVHVIRRLDRRGLASAVVEGFLSAKGDVMAVMDADGQHDVTILPKLFAAIQDGSNIAIASRYAEGGGVGEWDERRFFLSRIATKLAFALCSVSAHDPMSGYFAIDRKTFQETLPKLNPKGFKILLDFLVHVPKTVKVTEIPFTFLPRRHGYSKLTLGVQMAFLEYLYDVTLGRFVPLTFVKYCIVGTMGVFVHLSTYVFLSQLLRGTGDLSLAGFSLAVLGAIEVAIIFNFLLNNVWTFGYARLRGEKAFLGFMKFNLACGVGAIVNYGVATFLYSRAIGEISSVVIGSFVGVLWNYTMNRLMTWRS